MKFLFYPFFIIFFSKPKYKFWFNYVYEMRLLIFFEYKTEIVLSL